jgi:hypothetical protein
MAGTLDYTYQYPFASTVGVADGEFGLSLATCDARRAHPHFFSGRLREPRVVADLLLVLSDVVRTHYFLPRPANLDPVVTSSPEMLRFEGFSGCCGVYARVDLPAEAFDREIQGRGTTNVDFNGLMRASLGRLRDADQAKLAVGREGVELEVTSGTVVEKKVKLPVRWIKGFSEVQAYQPAMTLRSEVTATAARQFVRSLPGGSGPKRVSYIVQSGSSLRMTQLKSAGAIAFEGTNRIRALEPLLTTARTLRIWADDESGTSGWEVLFSNGRFFLMLSPELYRGFSGEGQVLEKLAGRRWQEALPYVQSQLAWQSQIDAAAVARKIGLTEPEVADSLAILGSRGLAGFDVSTGRYFHREMPFDLEQVETLQPRLKDARKLLADKAATIVADLGDGAFDVSVAGTVTTHHVRLRPDGDRCTCPWFSKHRGERGPCKHVLAAQMLVGADEDADA